MTKIAFIFPGQGSQQVGMGAAFIETSADSKKYYDLADKMLGFSLTNLMLNGPQEELTLTYHAQPALLTTGVMVAQKIMAAGITPHFTAGHSLGEYSAFVIANVLSFEDAVVAVHKRGLYMDEAVPAGQGAMAAILGLDADKLMTVCENITATGHAVQLANLNCPGQIVISGTKEGVERACSEAKGAGAKRAIPLVVSGPFHSTLMQQAADKLAETVAQLKLQTPTIPVVSNVTSQLLTDKEAIRHEMVQQVVSPVLWEENVRTLLAQGVTVFIECGPGKVLSGLVKKIDRSAEVHCVYDENSLQALLQASKEWA